jgi:hypothetical protein
MRNRVGLIVAALLTALVAAVTLLWSQGALSSRQLAAPVPSPSSPTPRPSTTKAPAPAPPAAPALTAPLLRAAPVSVKTSGFWSWALMDRRTGEFATSTNAQVTNVTASMIKAWLAADYLRRLAERGATPNASALRQLTIMIRDSDNNAASSFYRLNGAAASIKRLIAMCGLTDSRAYIDWAHTMVSARDATRMGACIGDGRAAGTKWTEWLLNEMRHVRGGGRFGIISVLPAEVASQTAIKNGWIARSDGKWHINCMAIGPDWVLSVMTVYPASRGMSHGIEICKSVTVQLMAKQ